MSMTPGQIMFYLDYDNKRAQVSMEEMYEDLERLVDEEEEQKSFIQPKNPIAWAELKEGEVW